MRWYWEGTSEHFIQQLKQHLVSISENYRVFYGEIDIDAQVGDHGFDKT